MTACLDEEAVLSFVAGALTSAERTSALEHIAECDDCRALVSVAARSSFLRDNEDPATAATTPAEGLGGRNVARARSSPTSAPVLPGDVLAGKYAVERVLGVGGMGVVVAARHTQLGQRVALKFLLQAACEVPGAIDRFLREGKAAARITSEHVARVADTGVLDNGSPYLVMEYLEGQDLAAVAADRGRLPTDVAVEYLLQACEAIVEAHDLGIIHRDLKPANLFLTQRKDGSPLVKVLDFGISKSTSGSQAQVTSTSVLMGSPRYMSPEQMLSAKDVDQRTDIWALGVVLFELVTGRPVWQADTVQGLCALIASTPAPRIRDLVPDAPQVLDDVIARCLTKERAERIAGVADLAVALTPVAPPSAQTSIDRILRIAKRPALVHGQPSAPAPTTTSPRRGWLAIATALLVATVLGLVVVRSRTDASLTTTPPQNATQSAGAVMTAAEPTPTTAPAVSETKREASAAPPPSAPRANRVRPRILPPPAEPVKPTAADSSSTSSAPPPAVSTAPSAPPSSRALSDRK